MYTQVLLRNPFRHPALREGGDRDGFDLLYTINAIDVWNEYGETLMNTVRRWDTLERRATAKAPTLPARATSNAHETSAAVTTSTAYGAGTGPGAAAPPGECAAGGAAEWTVNSGQMLVRSLSFAEAMAAAEGKMSKGGILEQEILHRVLRRGSWSSCALPIGFSDHCEAETYFKHGLKAAPGHPAVAGSADHSAASSSDAAARGGGNKRAKGGRGGGANAKPAFDPPADKAAPYYCGLTTYHAVCRGTGAMKLGVMEIALNRTESCAADRRAQLGSTAQWCNDATGEEGDEGRNPIGATEVAWREAARRRADKKGR